MNDNKTYNLYEYDKLQPLPTEKFNVSEFRNFLDDVWIKYKDTIRFWRDNLSEDNLDTDIKSHQQFLYIDDRYNFKSRNYVGYIKFQEYEFNLYPKICKNKCKQLITDLLLRWLKYSNIYNFPNYKTSMESYECADLFECLIYLYAKYTSELFDLTKFQHYDEISDETPFLKGKLNFSKYTNNILTGKLYKFNCTYDSFELDNKFNQIVKYVTKMLLSASTKNKEMLNKILLKLDEVEDVVCTYEDCQKVYINRFMEDFVTVLDFCKLFLQNCITFNQSGEFDTFAFLLRTEILFEDYISNLVKETMKEYTIKSQNISSLDDNGKYHICPDILVYNKGKNEHPIKIVDVKYKAVTTYSDISYSDIYQCIAYATKLNCKDVTLLYPRTCDCNFQANHEEIKVQDIEIKFRFIDCCSKNNSIEIRELLNLKKNVTNDQYTN